MCGFADYGGLVTWRTGTVAGCDNYRTNGCRFKLTDLLGPVNCKACAAEITPDLPCCSADGHRRGVRYLQDERCGIMYTYLLGPAGCKACAAETSPSLPCLPDAQARQVR